MCIIQCMLFNLNVNTCQIKQYYIMQPQSKERQTEKLTEEQLRQRRRERVLARANKKDTEQGRNSQQFSSRNSQQSKEGAQRMSAFQMHEASKRHAKLKFQLETAAIAMGAICSIVHIFSEIGEIMFVICFFLISLSSAYLQIVRTNKVEKFANQNAISDPIISKVTNIRQLNLVNKIINIQVSLSPLAKAVGSYFLVALLFANFAAKKEQS